MDATLTLPAVPHDLTLHHASEARWDVVVIGAGPAGAMAGYTLARAGVRVLLVDKARFPRRKVCGCCFNSAALAALHVAGLDDIRRRLNAPTLHTFHWAVDGTVARVPLDGGVAMSREAFDTELLRRARAAGATVLEETHASVVPPVPSPADSAEVRNTPSRLVTLRRGDETTTVRTLLVLVADGLGGRAIETAAGFQRAVDTCSRMGAGAIAPTDAAPDYEPGVIHMACGRDGYVGLVRLEDGRLDVAGAFDATFVRAAHGPGRAAVEILRSAGLPPVSSLADLPWHGTPWLTVSRPHVAGERVLVLGDAAGYVEPFTGEGLAWALGSSVAIAPIALQAIEAWRPDLAEEWSHWYASRIRPRQRWCRLVTRSLRRPLVTHWAARLVSHLPLLARPLVTHLAHQVD